MFHNLTISEFKTKLSVQNIPSKLATAQLRGGQTLSTLSNIS